MSLTYNETNYVKTHSYREKYPYFYIQLRFNTMHAEVIFRKPALFLGLLTVHGFDKVTEMA